MNNNSRAKISWIMYDWANSAFALTVMAAFFPGFFKGFWSFGVDATISTARLGLGNAAAGLIVAVLSPVLGALAGAAKNRKVYFISFAFLGMLSTASLFFVGKGFWLTALAVFILARIGFNIANLFYDTFLMDIAEQKDRHLLSSLGFGIGYLGCAILFIINIVMHKNPSLFGFVDSVEAIRYIFLSAALWWALFSIPMFLFVKEHHTVDERKSMHIIIDGLRNIGITTKEIFQDKHILLFLVAYWFYIDGVHTVVMMATDFGLSIGIEMADLMKALLVVQFVAFPCAIIFGLIAKKVGAVKSVIIAIIIYIIICTGGAFVLSNGRDFMFFAGLTGIAQGAIQALSRSIFTSMVPEGKEGEYFGFYNMMGRFAIILGPLLIGGVNLLFHSLGMESQLASRIGIASISILFIVGLVLLIKANVNDQ